MRLTRWLLAGAVAALLVTPAAGRVQADRSSQRAHGESGVLREFEISSDLWVPGTLDPATENDRWTNTLYSGLVKLDDQNQVVPDLAQALPVISADRLTYTFTLRPGLQFSDGSPLTSQDVLYSLSRALSKAEHSPLAPNFLGHIKGAGSWTAGTATSLAGVTAPDARIVRITLDTPISYFLSALSGSPAWVVKRGLAPGINLAAPHAQALTIASGPFMFGKPWRYRQEMYLIPNPHWYGASRVQLKELRIRFYTDGGAAFRGYQAGQVDVALCCEPHALMMAYRNNHNPDVHSALAPNIDFLTLNLGADALCAPAHCAPFNNLHFRRALLYAIDRSVLAQKIFDNWEVPLCGLIPQGVLGYDSSLCSLTPYDPARARAELALAKKDFVGAIPNDGSNTLAYVAGFTEFDLEAVALQEMWARVGIHIAVNAAPTPTWFGLRTKNSSPLFYNIWDADYPDPQDFAESLLTKASAFDAGNYDNPLYTRLVQQADTAADPLMRERLYIQAQRQALQDVAIIPLLQKHPYFIWRPTIHGFAITGVYTDFSKVSVD